jgi:N-methylhydantoinase A
VSAAAVTDRNLLVGIDVGGTFTDVVALDLATGKISSLKTPTTPADQSVGFLTGVNKIAAAMGVEPAAVQQILHGTTVATNAILEGKGAPAALITSEGFRHVLEIGRHDIPRKANMFHWVKPQRPVPPRLIYEVGGRMLVDGSEQAPLDEAAVHKIVDELLRQDLHTIAICLLHSYANPAHEQRVRDILLERMPDAMISLSSEVLPVFREYERSMVTILNAYVMPPVSHYVGNIATRLQDNGVSSSLLLMNSSGGVVSADTVRRIPVQTALSGPAAGALGAANVGIASGRPNVISIDIGGTSADVCLIKDGRPAITKRGTIGDWPVHTPMVDMVTIGAGGGSIARVSSGGSLAVGPVSAGAEPGPACYSRGGTLPTVTDAHMVLGRLCDSLDEMGLDRQAARDAIEQHIAKPLGLSVERAAEGILEVVNNNMVGAIRLVSVERGFDPRDFALLGFGGAGPLHSAPLARLLGMSTVLIPPNPGVLSAFGLVVADIRNDFSRTCLERPPNYDLKRIGNVFNELDTSARRWLASEGIAESESRTEWEASMRYQNQGFELTLGWPGSAVTQETLEKAFAAFHELHAQLYTFASPDAPIEIVTLHVTALGRLKRPAKIEAQTKATGKRDAVVGEQKLFTGGRFVTCPIYDREQLAPGAMIKGPAIIRQHDTTTVMEEGEIATLHPSGSLIIQLQN